MHRSELGQLISAEDAGVSREVTSCLVLVSACIVAFLFGNFKGHCPDFSADFAAGVTQAHRQGSMRPQ